MVIDREMLEDLLKYEPDPYRCTELSPTPCQIYWELRERVLRELEDYEISIYEHLIEVHILALAVSSNITAKEAYEDVWDRLKRKAKLILETEFKEGGK